MSAKTKQSEPKLADLPLPADQDVSGGLSSLQQLQHDTAKGVINNVRV